MNSAAKTKPTVLITGATGFLGTSLARRLLSAGYRVRVLARAPAKARPLSELGAEVVLGDVTDARAVSTALDGAATVWHLAGRLLVPGVPASEYERIHVDGTNTVVECCKASRHLERLVHCSTTGVLGATGDRPVDENAPMNPGNVYEATKARAEKTVSAASRDGLPAVVVRPGLVYGPGDLHLVGFFRAVLRRRFRPVGRRAVRLHPIYIDDLTDALLCCGREPAAIGECFHIAGAAPVTLELLAEAIARAGGTNLPAGHIPLPAARAVAMVGDLLPAQLKASAPLTSSRLEFLTHSRVYDVTKARRVLDFAAATDLVTGVRRTVAWYRQKGHLLAAARS